jgi:hypothetical protein
MVPLKKKFSKTAAGLPRNRHRAFSSFIVGFRGCIGGLEGLNQVLGLKWLIPSGKSWLSMVNNMVINID